MHVQWNVVIFGATLIIAGIFVHIYRVDIIQSSGSRAKRNYGKLGARVSNTNPIYMSIAGFGGVALGVLIIFLGIVLPPYK